MMDIRDFLSFFMARKEFIEKTLNLALDGHVIESTYFFFETEPKSQKKLAIVFGGFEKCASDFELKRRTYPYYVLEIPLRGKCDFNIGTNPYELEKGTLGGFAPGIPHHYKCDAEKPMEHIFIVFTGSQAKELFMQCGLHRGGVIRLSKPGETLYLAEAILKKGMEKTEYSHQLCCSYLRTLLLEQAAELAQPGHSASASTETYRHCRRYIDEHFSTIFSSVDVADAHGINVRYLARLFKRFGTITPHDYIMRLKLNKAASLLLTSDLSVKQVAEQVGFEDPYHFSRNFKKFHGLAPRHYRDAHLKIPFLSEQI